MSRDQRTACRRSCSPTVQSRRVVACRRMLEDERPAKRSGVDDELIGPTREHELDEPTRLVRSLGQLWVERAWMSKEGRQQRPARYDSVARADRNR